MCLKVMEVSREEAKRILRRLELEAYSSIVSTFRAQGDLNREKKKLLTELGVHLSISTERHRAEVRRAYSDDRLGAVADCIVGPTTCSEWAAEGRRLVPLMPRLVPQTVLSGTATASANTAAASNAQLTSQVKKTVGSSTTLTSSTREASLVKPSSVKQLARQSSETIDVEYDSDDNKAKKKRKLSQSVTVPKPIQKILLNPSAMANKFNTKTASVSTSTMTKVGKPASSAGNIKATQKLMLPASASQVKLLTKTVSITQTVCHAKTMLNYKTISATSPGAVKVQTVMSHTTPKTQVKVAGPSTAKNILVPKSTISTSPIKVMSANSPLKAGITMAQLVAKQRGKQTARFKPMPGTVKFKSVNPVTMGTSAVTMATPSSKMTTLTGSTCPTTSSTQPIVRVIQVSGTGGVGMSKPVVVMTTQNKNPTKAASSTVSGVPSIIKVPISSIAQTSTVTSTTQASRTATQSTSGSTLSSTGKTVVMTTIVGGTKKVVLSVPAPITPITPVHTKPVVLVSKPGRASGTGNQSQLTADSTKKIAEKLSGLLSTKKITASSLECTEPSSVLQAPSLIVSKTGTASTVSIQARARPLQTLLPAPPKPVAVPAATPGGRKLAQILPAPTKTSVLVPLAVPASQAACSTAMSPVTVVSCAAPVVSSNAPVVQLMAKSKQPTVVSKLSVSKPVPISSPNVSTLQVANVLHHKLQNLATSQVKSTESSSVSTQGKPNMPGISAITFFSTDTELRQKDVEPDSCTVHETVEGDSNTSSEDDSILVCSESIDSGTGLQDNPPTIDDLPSESDTATRLSSFETVTSEITSPEISSGSVIPPSVGFLTDEEIKEKEPIEAQIDKPCDFDKTPKIVPDSTASQGPIKTPSQTVISSTVSENNDNEIKIAKKIDLVSSTYKQKEEILNIGDGKTLPDFDAVSSFLQKFSNENEPNSSTKDSLDRSSNSTILLESSESQEENQETSHTKPEAAPLFQEDDGKKMPQMSPKSSSLSGSLDIEDISVSIASDMSGSEGSSFTSDGFGFKDIHVASNIEHKNDHVFGGSSESFCSIFGKEVPDSLHVQTLKEISQASAKPSINDFTQSSTGESATDLTKSLNELPSDNLKSCPSNLSLGVGFIDNMFTQSSSSEGQDLTESEKLALEAIANVRTSGRKRKPPSVLTLSPPRQTSGWIRGALSLLQKVCSYRGQGRKKGDYSAASWFLRPVDQNEAPGYFKVIKTPMDLGTIKAKLEAGLYQDYIEFHEDMLLVKMNCFKYNPQGHDIRKDCEEVFNYFDVEYEKMLERWEKCHVSPAKKPRTMPKPDLAASISW